MRTVIESRQFETEKAMLGLDAPELDSILSDITFAISVRPDLGKPTGDPNILAIATDGNLVMPALVLYYAYNETEVLLISIRPWDIRGNGQDYGGTPI